MTLGMSFRAAASLALAAAVLLSAATVSMADSPPTLYVLLCTDVKSMVLEKTLREKLSGLNVTVFGRFRDFEQALSTKPPDAVLAAQPVLAARKLEPTLRGVSNGRDVESFVLLSAGAALDGPLANRTIGVVDLLGRADTQTFVATLLKTPDIRLKLVTKLEDLLSLLQFSAADAILVPADVVKTFTDRTRLSLHVRALPDALVGRAALTVLTPSARGVIVRQVQSLDAATNRLMGVSSWRSQ